MTKRNEFMTLSITFHDYTTVVPQHIPIELQEKNGFFQLSPVIMRRRD